MSVSALNNQCYETLEPAAGVRRNRAKYPQGSAALSLPDTTEECFYPFLNRFYQFLSTPQTHLVNILSATMPQRGPCTEKKFCHLEDICNYVSEKKKNRQNETKHRKPLFYIFIRKYPVWRVISLHKDFQASIAVFCICTARFVSDLVGNSEDRVSQEAAQFYFLHVC